MPASPSDDLPVANPVTSFWTAPPDPLDNYRSTPDLPSTCDILIIGSGYAGVGTACHIFNHPRYQLKSADGPAKPKSALPSTVLLEARGITSGATGRNGGHIKPDTYAGITRYASLYGWEQAAKLQKFESEQVYLVKQMLEKEGLLEECEFHMTRAVDAIMNEEVAKTKLREYKEMLRQGIVDLRDVDCAEGQAAERVSGVKGVKAIFTFTAAHCWPKRMVQGLLRKLIDRGLQVYSHTPVIGIEEDRSDTDGYRWTVSTGRGSIKANKVVLCTNAYTSSVLPQYKDKIIPVRGVCSHIASPKTAKTPHLPCTYSLRFDAQQYDYLIPRADGSIIVGGARSAFWPTKSLWYDNRSDNELVAGGKEYFHNYMQKYFHGWEDSQAEVKHIWTGIMGYTSDLVPHIGAVPGVEGQYIVAGFSGHGMPQIFSATKGVARMVVEDIGYEETGLPELFRTTRERLEERRNWMEEGLRVVWEGRGKL